MALMCEYLIIVFDEAVFTILASRNAVFPKFSPSATRRVAQIFDKPEFFVDGAGYNDIVQGNTVPFLLRLILTNAMGHKASWAIVGS